MTLYLEVWLYVALPVPGCPECDLTVGTSKGFGPGMESHVDLHTALRGKRGATNVAFKPLLIWKHNQNILYNGSFGVQDPERTKNWIIQDPEWTKNLIIQDPERTKNWIIQDPERTKNWIIYLIESSYNM